MQALCERDISIIIPVYNLENFLAPMLTSLKAQRLGGYTAEIIFVLNNCTDRSGDVIRESGLDCTIINCEKQGCGPARNAGLDIARGRYVWLMDGDDWLLSDEAVKDVLDKATAEELDVLLIPFRSDFYPGQYFSMVWQYLIRRDFVYGIRFPDYQPAEDDAFIAAVLRRAGHTRGTYFCLPRMDRPLYFYNYGRPGSNMMRYHAGEKI